MQKQARFVLSLRVLFRDPELILELLAEPRSALARMVEPEIRHILGNIDRIVPLSDPEPVLVVHAEMFVRIEQPDLLHNFPLPKDRHLGDEVFRKELRVGIPPAEDVFVKSDPLADFGVVSVDDPAFSVAPFPIGFPESIDYLLERSGSVGIVAVEIGHDVSGHKLQSFVDRIRLPGILFGFPDEIDPFASDHKLPGLEEFFVFPDDFDGPVGGKSVHDDILDLEISSLRNDREDGPLDEFLLVVGRGDDGDFHDLFEKILYIFRRAKKNQFFQNNIIYSECDEISERFCDFFPYEEGFL